MGERWHMSDSPPLNGHGASEHNIERRRPRGRDDTYYDDVGEGYRGKKRSRDVIDRGSRREYRHDPLGSRGERHSRRDAGDYDNYTPRGRPHRDEGRPPWNDDPRPPLNAILKASVYSVRSFGLLVSLPDYKRHGLVYHTQVSDGIAFDRDDDDDSKLKALNYYFPVGKEVWVKIVDVRIEFGMLKISCSMKAVSQVDGKDLDPENVVGKKFQSLKEDPPEVGTVHKATVQSVKSYGAFVRLEGYKSNGLVHSSQVGAWAHKLWGSTFSVCLIHMAIKLCHPLKLSAADFHDVHPLQDGCSGRGSTILQRRIGAI